MVQPWQFTLHDLAAPDSCDHRGCASPRAPRQHCQIRQSAHLKHAPVGERDHHEAIKRNNSRVATRDAKHLGVRAEREHRVRCPGDC